MLQARSQHSFILQVRWISILVAAKSLTRMDMLFIVDVIEPWIINRVVLPPGIEGYGNMCAYSPYTMHDIQMGNGTLAQLDFLILNVIRIAGVFWQSYHTGLCC